MVGVELINELLGLFQELDINNSFFENILNDTTKLFTGKLMIVCLTIFFFPHENFTFSLIRILLFPSWGFYFFPHENFTFSLMRILLFPSWGFYFFLMRILLFPSWEFYFFPYENFTFSLMRILLFLIFILSKDI